MATAGGIAVLIDRSRDALAPDDLLSLHQDETFQVTENHQPLTPALLEGYRVLVVQCCGSTGYSEEELAAVERFVGAGGGLLLATSAGLFETHAALPVGSSAAGRLAGVFGFRFRSPTEAEGRCRFHPASLDLGYRSDELRLKPAGPLVGLRRDDLAIERAGALEVPAGARVLLRHRGSGEAVLAWRRWGRGKVLVAGWRSVGRPWLVVGVPVVSWLSARRRSRPPSDLPDLVDADWLIWRRGPLHIRFAAARRRERTSFLRLLDGLVSRIGGIFSRPLVDLVQVEATAGVGVQHDYQWRGGRWRVRIGLDNSQPMLVFHLASSLVRVWLLGRGGHGGIFWRGVGLEGLCAHLGLRAMEWLGFGEESVRLRHLLEGVSPDGFPPPGRVDLSRWYPEAGPAPTVGLWRGLEEEFGFGLIQRFLRRPPEDLPRGDFPFRDAFTNLDFLIWHLSRCAGRDLSGWFAARGVRSRSLPLVSPRGAGFRRGCRRRLEERLRDRSQPVSERYDALIALCREREGGRGSSGAGAGTGSGDEVDALVEGALLARSRDRRAWALLGRLARSSDTALAAIASLLLLEGGRVEAARRLTELARGCDTRFRLLVRAQLRRLGHDLPVPLRLLRRRDSRLRLFAVVEGYPAANVFSEPVLERWPGGIAVPSLFFHWVHTSPAWRRSGLARLLFERTDADRWARGALTSSLWTGTSNPAHALYRSRGFIDLTLAEEWTRSLGDLPPPPRLKGLRLRRVRPGDEPRICDLVSRVYRSYFGVRRRRPAHPLVGDIALLAEEDGCVRGYLRGVLGPPDGEGRTTAHITEVCVEVEGEEERAERITSALVLTWCARAERSGAGRVQASTLPESLPVRNGFQAAGFRSRPTEGVFMWRLRDLPGLLLRLVPLFEGRLRGGRYGRWCGVVALLGRTHRAALRIERGRVEVLASPPSSPDIALSGGDEVISRLVIGRQTPSNALLQLELSVTPPPGAEPGGLLDALFPRVPLYLR